ncbi:MAG: pyridoxamine 5'-phosphate oxidase family protein [Rubrivivax sp.]|nr:pyridoxamine 5'-phosphate oxidase family protein [Pyrinomonadaceae bacterium]
MRSVYHAGEVEVQSRAGVRTQAERIGRGIHSVIPPAARSFMLELPMAIVGSVGADGRVWASVISGEPGFIRAIDERAILIGALPADGDPLGENLKEVDQVGVLLIEPSSRRRMRLNGRAELGVGGGIRVEASQVYSNCPKYIQAREWESVNSGARRERRVSRTTSLDEEQRLLISSADTFFIASYHPEGGADASHRGGRPGFVSVADERKLLWPDYPGNQMFQTLGNIESNPRAGLLFIDFERGGTLQLSGKARVIWDEDAKNRVAGAERVVEFEVERVVEIARAVPLRWRLLDYSSFI